MKPNPDPMSQFATNVGLITSRGEHGDNIMSCEWTHHISYDPQLILIALKKRRTTHNTIVKTKEFGVSIASISQNWIASIAGNAVGSEHDKVKALMELGVEFYEANKISVLMVKNASANLECKLIKYIDIGDHPLLIGEVIAMSKVEEEPLVYHLKKFWHLEPLNKVPKKLRDERNKIIVKYRR